MATPTKELIPPVVKPNGFRVFLDELERLLERKATVREQQRAKNAYSYDNTPRSVYQAIERAADR